jgi:hypothetical protein
VDTRCRSAGASEIVLRLGEAGRCRSGAVDLPLRGGGEGRGGGGVGEEPVGE